MSRCFHKKFKFCAWNCRSVEESWDSVHDIDHKCECTEFEFEFIGVLRHMEQYFSHICDGTDVQADWKRSCTYGRAPNAMDIS